MENQNIKELLNNIKTDTKKLENFINKTEYFTDDLLIRLQDINRLIIKTSKIVRGDVN